MFYKMLIFKAEDRLRSHVLPPPSENRFHDGIDSHKDPIRWNRCLLVHSMGAMNRVKMGLSFQRRHIFRSTSLNINQLSFELMITQREERLHSKKFP
jgi:hypothetical protein